MDIDRTIDVFGAGFSTTRGFTHPFEYVQVGKLRVMRDRERTKGEERVQEILVHGLEPAEAVDEIRRYAPKKFFVCAIEDFGQRADEYRDAYKSLHFRLLRREPLFVRRTSVPLTILVDHPVRRVTTTHDAERVRAHFGRQILGPHLAEGDAALRLYVAEIGGEIAGSVRSIRGDAGAAWVSNLIVRPEFRRRGIAQSLLKAMLEDDARYGIEWSVLLASGMGTPLYRRVGYEQIATLQMFAPIKDRWA